MPNNPLIESDLANSTHALSNVNKSVEEHFRDLELSYSRFEKNEENLINLEHVFNLNTIQQNYTQEKQACEERLRALKILFKQIDNRIIAAEQKLTHGIPQDLELMDKLIAEQESIVDEQERLNAAELLLIDEVSKIDIEHGKALEKNDQIKMNKISPLKNRFLVYQKDIEQAKKNIRFRSGLIYLIPMIGFPIIIDLLANVVGLSKPGLISKNHNIFGHYMFLIALIAFQIFFSDKVKNLISGFLASVYLNTSFKELAILLSKNLKNVKEFSR